MKNQIQKLIEKNLPDFTVTVPEKDNQNQKLFELLKAHVNHLLDHDMAGLLQALYRMDVNENSVKKILTEAPADKLSIELTQLIILRAGQKLETRKKYSVS